MIVRDGGRGDDSGREGWRGVAVRDGGVMTVCDECVCVCGGGDDSEGWRKR